MSRRLLNRGRASAANSRTTTAVAAETTDLPDYEPPSCPLNDSARRALGELSNNRGTAVFEHQLKEAIRYTGNSVGDLHERLRARHERLARLRHRRQGKGTEKSEEEEHLEVHIPELEAQVEELSRDSERSIRDIIDKRAELEDEGAVLGDVYTTAATTNGHRSADEEEDDKNANQQPSILDKYRELLSEKRSAYDNLSLLQRYGLNNDYAGFKKLWHDAAAGEDGPPLPDAAKWFRPDGEPIMSRVAGSGSGNSVADDAGSDDDIAVAREVLSLNCPLTLRPMEEPYSNAKCKHTFEKSAILEYLPDRGEVQCPQTGCSQTFSMARFERDFYLDLAILRRIQRAKQAERTRDTMDVDDDEEVDGEGKSVIIGTQRRVRGRDPKRET